jgi:hypothetical protein
MHAERVAAYGLAIARAAGIDVADERSRRACFAVADTLDALTTDRPYRKAVGFAHAREEILRGAGTQFDPAMIAAYETIGDEMFARLGEGVRSAGGA